MATATYASNPNLVVNVLYTATTSQKPIRSTLRMMHACIGTSQTLRAHWWVCDAALKNCYYSTVKSLHL